MDSRDTARGGRTEPGTTPADTPRDARSRSPRRAAARTRKDRDLRCSTWPAAALRAAPAAEHIRPDAHGCAIAVGGAARLRYPRHRRAHLTRRALGYPGAPALGVAGGNRRRARRRDWPAVRWAGAGRGDR